MRQGSIIAGEERGGGAWIEVVDPADASVYGEVARASVEECLDAVDAAAAAAAEWSQTPPRVRAEVLRTTFELLRADSERIAEIIVRENGKSRADARSEMDYAAEFFRWYSEEAVRIGGELRQAPDGDKRIIVSRAPIGVSLLITPWNFPAAMATRKLAPALAAGCTTVLKPASETPLTAYAIAGVLVEAGLPPGVVNVVCPSPSAPAVTAMMSHPAVRSLSFTGSTEVGVLLLERAATRVLRCSMELGGNAPFIVFEDSDVDAAVDGALVAKMRNGGASCIAANRFYVHERIRTEFVARLAKRMARLKMGAGLADDTMLGPMVSERERRRLSGLVDDAAGRGARVLCGGAHDGGPGFFYPATVLDGIAPDDPIVDVELFGPVAAIVEFADEDDVVGMANASEHGLAAYVYSNDLARALRVAEGLQTGMVGINRGFISDPAAPFGGVKASGLGREGGHEGVAEFLETKYVAVDWGSS